MDKMNRIGFCEGCGLDIITIEMWYDVEHRLCYECAEYSEESASETDCEVYYDDSTDTTDSEIDDPTYRPPKRYRVYWSDDSSDDDDDFCSGEVDRVGSF